MDLVTDETIMITNTPTPTLFENSLNHGVCLTRHFARLSLAAPTLEDHTNTSEMAVNVASRLHIPLLVYEVSTT